MKQGKITDLIIWSLVAIMCIWLIVAEYKEVATERSFIVIIIVFAFMALLSLLRVYDILKYLLYGSRSDKN